ncbi:MAG: hypothetical protein GY729_18735 [Desulfobacteraceae bacterium]|nr:hypothetical protein [Desulfobacteraceae bacterium]
MDLNLSTPVFKIDKDLLVLGHDTSVSLKRLTDISMIKNRIFMLKQDQLIPVEIREQTYMKLVPTDTAPTLEIDGVKMHRSKDISPLEDARLKTKIVVKKGARVLDTCGGLGYSALYAIKNGAREVISTEKSQSVMQLRAMNPWFGPEDHDNITFLHADITDFINTSKDEFFDAVIHDPPRFSSATGDLYGKVFYTSLYRVLKKGGQLFHYTGTPKRIKNNDRFVKNCIQRLENCGFGNIVFHDHLQGLVAKRQ